ncbi:MAG: hypothetical protein KC561_18020, partial [Myxococcales bacterium]|nr:hypothetical protein [Myxococcales bacterium]
WSERARDPSLVSESIEQLDKTIEGLRGDLAKWSTDTDRVRLARHLVRKCICLRLLGRAGEAIGMIDEAIDLYRTADRPTAVGLSLIRKVQSLVAVGDLEAALDQARQLEADGRLLDAHRDLLLQWSGLAHVQRGEVDLALADWRECLQIREARPNARGSDEIRELIDRLDSSGRNKEF